jgi:hypothetical protein
MFAENSRCKFFGELLAGMIHIKELSMNTKSLETLVLFSEKEVCGLYMSIDDARIVELQ